MSFFGKTRRGGGEDFFSGRGFFFTGRGGGLKKLSLLEVWREGRGGEEKIFFLNRGFFYRELYWTKNFFTGRMEGFKSRLCLRFGGKEGRRKFFSDQGFFYRKDGRFQKSSLLKIWREGGEENIFFLGPRIFLQGRWEGAFLGPRKNKGVKREKKNKE
jgi:hypothetical protein